MCFFCTRRRTADDFSAVPAADFELLAVLGAAAADRPPAAAVAGRAVPAANPVLAVPVATHIAPAPTARAAHHAGHAAADAAPAARRHVQSHTLRVRGKSTLPSLLLLLLLLLLLGQRTCSPKKSPNMHFKMNIFEQKMKIFL